MCGTNVTRNNHELNNWIQEFGLLDKMHLLGHRNDVQRIYSALDVKAVASRYGEAFPMVICESMACGTPCVVTDIGDSAYIVGDTGITVEKENPNALAEAFLKILKMDITEKKKLSAEARERIDSLFSLEKIVHEYEKYYY
jgi:glycosyltransferase involved in cell wall biosynthesis